MLVTRGRTGGKDRTRAYAKPPSLIAQRVERVGSLETRGARE